jgi:hypothetical protein
VWYNKEEESWRLRLNKGRQDILQGGRNGKICKIAQVGHFKEAMTKHCQK